MIQNKLFRDCLAAIPAEQKAEFNLSFGIAERISEILKAKGLTQKDFARLLNKRDSEFSKWLTGRHNFTTQTIARIENQLLRELVWTVVVRTVGHDSWHTVCIVESTDEVV